MGSDVIDNGNEAAQFFVEAAERKVRNRVKAEQVQNEDGSWPITECVDCGIDIPEGRLALGKVRCIDCQSELEYRSKRFVDK